MVQNETSTASYKPVHIERWSRAYAIPTPCPTLRRPQPLGRWDIRHCTSQGCGRGRLTTRDSLNSWFRSASSAASTRFCGRGWEGESQCGKEARGPVRSTARAHPRELGTDSRTSTCARMLTASRVTVARRQVHVTGTGSQSFQLHDIVGKVRLGTQHKGQWSPGVCGEGWMSSRQAGFLSAGRLLCVISDDGDTSSYVCPNARNVHRRERTLVQTADFG